MLLASQGQAVSQRLRQSRRSHSFLYLANIIGHAPEFDGVVFQIRDRETGARISVSRLPNRAGVQQIALFVFDPQGAMFFVISRVQLQHFELGVQVGEAALVMSVSVKCHLRGGIQQPFERLRGRKNVFILVLDRAVHQRQAFGLQWPLR